MSSLRGASGRPPVYCSPRCRVLYRNAHSGNGGPRAWPRDASVEREVCRAYVSGLSAIALAEQYGVNGETIRRVLKRNEVPIRHRNASTPRKRLKGGRISDQHGYACVLIEPDDPLYAHMSGRGCGKVTSAGSRYVPEHRLVMARLLGRPLKAHETVHHINGVRDDNRPENLELWASPHRKGQRVDDLIAFVVENYPEATRAALDGEQRSLWTERL